MIAPPCAALLTAKLLAEPPLQTAKDRVTPDRARTRRRLAGLAASTVAHLAVFAVLASLTPTLIVAPHARRSAAAIEVELEAAGGATGVRAVSAAASASRAPASVQAPSPGAMRPSQPATAMARATPAPTLAAAPPGLVHPALAAPPAVPTGGAGAGPSRWRVDGSGVGGAAGDAARALARTTVGCDRQTWLHLTADERARCERPFVEGYRSGLKIDAVPAAKRATYDQVQAAYAKMHAGAPLPFTPPLADRYGNLGVTERWAGPPGAHRPGFGCKLGLGPPPRDWKSYHDKAPHSLKLGRLPCFITPPSGVLTEEADVQAPASLREQTDDAAHAAKYDPPTAPR